MSDADNFGCRASVCLAAVVFTDTGNLFAHEEHDGSLPAVQIQSFLAAGFLAAGFFAAVFFAAGFFAAAFLHQFSHLRNRYANANISNAAFC